MFNTTLRRFVVSSAAVMLALAGCYDPIKAPPAGQADTILLVDYPQIVVIDGLQPYLGFHRPIVEPGTPQRPMNVTVPVRSLSDVRMGVQYQFRFFDQVGRQLGETGWTFQNMEPRLMVRLRGAAMQTTAESWQLEVRTAR